jgi:hypothetical protein
MKPNFLNLFMKKLKRERETIIWSALADTIGSEERFGVAA